MENYHYHLYTDDLPEAVLQQAINVSAVAIDTETTGLKLYRDRLCLIQLCLGDGVVHLIEVDQTVKPAPNLSRLLTDPNIVKLFHFARFDVAMLYRTYQVLAEPIFCSKIASKLARTNVDKHGLSDLCRDLLGVSLAKAAIHTDWANQNKTPQQLAYACDDVLYLHALKQALSMMLKREGRDGIAQKCMQFLPQRALLDVMGFEDGDLFAHH